MLVTRDITDDEELFILNAHDVKVIYAALEQFRSHFDVMKNEAVHNLFCIKQEEEMFSQLMNQFDR